MIHQLGRSATLAITLSLFATAAIAQQAPAPTHGHSMNGDVFNEGPRQHAYLMRGMSNVVFPVSTHNRMAQRFFNQGVAQLHGFWYFEAERSFRQVAALDPTCAMAYWGMAMANVNNEKRARDFIAKSTALSAQASPGERAWIEALAGFYKPDQKPADRDKAFIERMRALAIAYPDNLEAKAFYCLFRWRYADNVPIQDYAEVDSMYRDILNRNPLHPLHHYRIHLWNYRDDKKALNSAGLSGPSSPGIAHMWHMQGHTYSVLHRYADAAWSQEASARVDHAQMNRNRIMPDEIFNYAHNNQWLVEDLGYVGRVTEAVDLAKNMIELPRHPAFNTMGGGGSASQGRMRLVQILTDYQLWDEAIALSRTNYLEPTALFDKQLERLHLLILAGIEANDYAVIREASETLSAWKRSGKAPSPTGEQGLRDDQKTAVADNLRLVDLGVALKSGDRSLTAKLLEELGDKIPREQAARWWLKAGNTEKAIEVAKSALRGNDAQVAPQACLVEALFAAGKRPEALIEFKKLREMSGSIGSLDMSAVPMFRRLSQIAESLGLPIDWRLPEKPREDIGPRPRLDRLGPFRWHPVEAANWSLTDRAGKRVQLSDYTAKGRPVVMILYLGSGCTACVEQLNQFAPLARKFDEAGISLVAIGVDPRKRLGDTLTQCKAPGGFPFPVLADDAMKVFHAYRAYDDFEKMPLHGLYLIDGKGLVRWQDISYKPFGDPQFVLDEAKRLLQLPEIAQTGVPALALNDATP